jgi:hypothetical protein
MVSFQFLFALIVINLFVAVILEGFEESSSLEDANLSEFYLGQFKKEWQNFDRYASGLIKCQDLPMFLSRIKLPWDDKDTELDVTPYPKPGDTLPKTENKKFQTLVRQMHLPIMFFESERRAAREARAKEHISSKKSDKSDKFSEKGSIFGGSPENSPKNAG